MANEENPYGNPEEIKRWASDPENMKEIGEVVVEAIEIAKRILRESRPSDRLLDEPFTI